MKGLAYLWTALIPIRQASTAKKEWLGAFKDRLTKAGSNAKQERLAYVYVEERLDCNKAGLNAKQARLANMMRKDFAIMSA